MLKRRPALLQCVEMIVMFAVLMAIDHLLLEGDAFFDLNPNPYWLPVLVMAIAYGSGLGLIAGAIASVIWLTWPHDWPGAVDELEKQLRLSILPMLWMVTALVVGEVTARRLSRIAEQDTRHQLTNRNWQKLAKVIAQLTDTNRKLQVRIATEQRTINRAIDALVGLSEPEPAHQLDAITRLVALALQTDDFTFYDVRSEQVIARFAGKEAEGRPSELSGTVLAQAMIAAPAPIYQDEPGEHPILGHYGLAGLPVFSQTGELSGLIVIHSAVSQRLGEARMAELAHVVDLLGKLPVFSRGCDGLPEAAWVLPEGKVA